MSLKTRTRGENHALVDLKKLEPANVLLIAENHPTGLLEIGSAAKRQAGADVEIVQKKEVDLDEVRLLTQSYIEHRRETKGVTPDEASAAVSVQIGLERLGVDLMRQLVRQKPNVIGLRVQEDQIDSIGSYIYALRQFSSAKIVLGGPTATEHPIHLLRTSHADFVFTGESERTFSKFCNIVGSRREGDRMDMEDVREFADLGGIAYEYGGRLYHNTLPQDGWGRTAADDPDIVQIGQGDLRQRVKPHATAQDINENPLDFTLLKGFSLNSVHISAGRGCRGVCIFCDRFHGDFVRAKRADLLIKDLENFDKQVSSGDIELAQYDEWSGVKDPAFRDRRGSLIVFGDDDFLQDKERAKQFFRLWEKSELSKRYRLGFQTNPVSMIEGAELDAELMGYVDRLKPAVQLGGEGFNDDMLKRMHKRHRSKHLRKALDGLDAAGVDYTMFVILSDYQQSSYEYLETLKDLVIDSAKRPHMTLGVNDYLGPEKGSDLRRDLEFSKRIDPDTFLDPKAYRKVYPRLCEDPMTRRLVDLSFEKLKERDETSTGQDDHVRLTVAVYEAAVQELSEAHTEEPGGKNKELLWQATRNLKLIRRELGLELQTPTNPDS